MFGLDVLRRFELIFLFLTLSMIGYLISHSINANKHVTFSWKIIIKKFRPARTEMIINISSAFKTYQRRCLLNMNRFISILSHTYLWCRVEELKFNEHQILNAIYVAVKYINYIILNELFVLLYLANMVFNDRKIEGTFVRDYLQDGDLLQENVCKTGPSVRGKNYDRHDLLEKFRGI